MTRNGSYVYNESDMYQEEHYLKKRLVTFVKELGMLEGLLFGMKLQRNT